MKVAVIGSGYVGLCTGVGLASLGHHVITVDIDKSKVDVINSGKPPIYEDGLQSLLKQVLEQGTFKAAHDVRQAVMSSQITFICVGTPSNSDGSMDLSYISMAAQEIGTVLKDSPYHIVIVKSTVLPGTTDGVVRQTIEKFSKKKAGSGFGLAMNPEFLREGSAMHDFFNPDRIVIGEFDQKSGSAVQKLYEKLGCPVMHTTTQTAEMIKYASNAFLATKISFINELGNLCKSVGIDTYDVAKGMGLDKRIGHSFLQAGVGFGGSCFPKDVSALMSQARSSGHPLSLLETVMRINDNQPQIMLDLLEKRIGSLSGKKIAVLGLAFKRDTDDIRESRSIAIVSGLVSKGASVNAYDPKAMDNFKKLFSDIRYCNSAKQAIASSDAVLILTDWNEFKSLKQDDFGPGKVVIEGRRIPGNKVKHEGLCW